MTCTGCGEAPGVVPRRHVELCQFCYDCLRHELKIRLDAIRDHGIYDKDNRPPNFGVTYATGPRQKDCLRYGLYLSRTPRQAMEEALRIAQRNTWLLLYLDIQKTLTRIFVSPYSTQYLIHSKLAPLPYDEDRYGALSTQVNRNTRIAVSRKVFLTMKSLMILPLLLVSLSAGATPVQPRCPHPFPKPTGSIAATPKPECWTGKVFWPCPVVKLS